MKSKLLTVFAAVFLGVGAFIGHNLFPNTTTVQSAAPRTAVSNPPPSFTANPSATIPITASGLDRATESGYAAASPSVVYVESVGVGSGSGVVYNTQGYIVTNAHVVNGATSLKVTLNDGRVFSATLVGTDKADDLAVIQIHASGLTAARFAGAGATRVAQVVLAIGSPLGLKQSVTLGLVSGLGRVEQEPNGAYLPDAVQTSAPINPGNSGGALVALDGTVVGIPTLEQTSAQNGASAQAIGFAVPSTRVTLVVNQLIKDGKVIHTNRAYLGISPADVSSQSTDTFGGFGQQGSTPQVASGALVQTLSSSGPAARAGVQQGDVITSVNGTPITSASDLLTALAQLKPGDTANLKLNRNGTSVDAQVHLGEMPA